MKMIEEASAKDARFNLTIVELKWIRKDDFMKEDLRFNLTIVELK